MEFFSAVLDALTETEITQKLQKTQYIQKHFMDYTFCHESPVVALQAPSYAPFCKVIHPTRLQRPKGGNSQTALAKILHSIAHIEYNAIDLGLDAVYRFRNLPQEYYADFIALSCEEVGHFALLHGLLHELGFEYGDFAVHDNLFCAMQSTPTLIERMALVHKGLEALGLDANPFVRQKIEQSDTPLKPKILEALDVILRDEIGHVAKGIKWLSYAQTLHDDTRTLREIVGQYDFNIIGKIPNTEARIKAGYTQEEIESLMP